MPAVFAGLMFSSPWMLGFLVAVALPWWLAWRAQPAPKRVDLATTSLVIAAARRHLRWRQPPHWLLPLLRSLILVAIAVAAAEPAWKGAKTGTLGPTRRVLLLDDAAADTTTAPMMAALEALADLQGDGRMVLEQMSAASTSPQHIPPDTALVILADGAVPPRPLRAWLGAWVESGGGVLALIGPESTTPDGALGPWLADLAGVRIAGQHNGPAEGLRRPFAAAGSAAVRGPTVQRYAELAILPQSPSSTIALAAPQTFLETTSSEPLLIARGVGQGRVAISALPWTLPPSATLSDTARWSDLPAWPVFTSVVEDLLDTFTPTWDHLTPPPTAAGSLWLATHDLARLCLVVALALFALEMIVRRSWKRPRKRPGWDWRCGAIQVTSLALLTLMLLGVRHASPTPPPREAPQPSETLALTDLVMPPVAWIGDAIDVEVVATRRPSPARGSGATGPVVELVDQLGRVVSQAALTPTPEASDTHRETWRALLSWSPEDAGLQRFTARLAASDGPTATTTLGHTLPAFCGVAAAPRRVLIIDGTARWETRHLARILRSTPGVEVQMTLLEADSAVPIPTTADGVAAFSTVVLGAFDPRDLPSGAAEAIAAAALKRSVGVVWTLDGRCDLAALAGSPLGAILPCVPIDAPISWPVDQRLRVLPTPAAAGFPWMAPLLRAADRADSEASFPALARARHSTAVAPLLFAASPASENASDASPALLIDHTPTGRVLATLGVTWRWRAGGSSDDVDAFWRSAVRFVAEPHLTQQLGEPLKSALRDAERQRHGLQTAVGPAPDHAVSFKVPRSSEPVWNHPLLIAIVILCLATSWRLCRSE